MGSPEGALRTAAGRVGLAPAEYVDRVSQGLRYCYRCQDWHPSGEFGRDSSRSDGLGRSCRRSKNVAERRAYKPKPRQSGRRFVAARDGDQEQARRRVNYLVSSGLLPHPNGVPCMDCGHEHVPGQRRHEYDHHRGYDAAHHEDVEAVCTTCHHAREDARRTTK